MAGTGSETELVATAIRGRVRRTWRAILAVRGTESVLLSATSGVLGLAAAVGSGAGLSTASAWVGAGLCAVAGGAAWWFEHRVAPRDVARRMDHRLQGDGALLTAWEAARRPEPSPVAALLLSRVRERHLASRSLRPVLPESLPLTVLPFLAVALLAVALDRTRTRDDAPVGSLVAGLATELGALREDLVNGALPELSQQDAERLVDLSTRAARLRRELEDGRPESEAAAELGALEAEMADLARRLDPGDAEHLDRARSWADSARRAVAEPRDPAAGSPVGTAAAEPSSGGEVASGSGDGTMFGHPDPGLGPEAGSEGPAGGDPAAVGGGEPAPETGVLAGRWWPPRHDRVVERWLTRSRSSTPEAR